MEAFATSREHVLAELEWIDLFIRLHIYQLRKRRTADERFVGLYNSDPELNGLHQGEYGPTAALLADRHRYSQAMQTHGRLIAGEVATWKTRMMGSRYAH